MSNGGTVVAAGAVVTRRGAKGGREVLLVHRPKYDDWAFPKGKQDPGEHVTTTAVREVLEETGVEVRLGRPLPPQRYEISGGRQKQVHYWVARVAGDDDLSTYQRNDEIDDLAWVPLRQAARRLTYPDDVALLERFGEVPQRTSALLVVRHGKAVKRKNWDGEDDQRPLQELGIAQAHALSPLLAAYGVTRLVSSPSTRCIQTLAAYAEEHVIPVEPWPGLSEEGHSRAAAEEVVARSLGQKESTAICSHRPVLPDLLAALGVSEEPLETGEVVVCHHRGRSIVATERHAPVAPADPVALFT